MEGHCQFFLTDGETEVPAGLPRVFDFLSHPTVYLTCATSCFLLGSYAIVPHLLLTTTPRVGSDLGSMSPDKVCCLCVPRFPHCSVEDVRVSLPGACV